MDAELRELCERLGGLLADAPAGPFSVVDDNDDSRHPLWVVQNEAFDIADDTGAFQAVIRCGTRADAELVAAMLNSAPTILSTIAAQAAELEGVREHCRQLTGDRFSDRNHAALKSRAERAEAELEGVRKSATEVYAAIPNLPVTPETCEAATDAFVLFCNAFNDHIADTAIADSGAGGGE